MALLTALNPMNFQLIPF
ncbi:Protein of unknown function [Lactobacillus acidophilus DSM 20079 = JCM 1132 = NBRC 13951 = CIP 76.13]|nr:Protein of unknown function [Lactobacillus acidophilus DSM 20079 = JCM 1132 = NBRC 13951 = CIP 76.13]